MILRRKIRTYVAALGFVVAIASATAVARGPAAAPRDSLAGQLEKILTSHNQPKARLGARVVELPSGKVLFDLGGETPMVPASNMKLIVMCAALDALGKDYQYKTTLAVRGNDLIIIGGGDPTLGDERIAQQQGKPITDLFRAWAGKLKTAGITHIKGNLVVDDSLFDKQWVHPSWPPPQYQAWYEAPIGGLNFASNCLDVRVQPTKKGNPAEVSFVPANTLFGVTNKSVTGAKSTVSASRTREGDTIVVSGTVSRESKLGPITVRDPGMYVGHVLKTVLASNGVRIDGKVIRNSGRFDPAKLPVDCKVIDTYRAPITWALARCGKQSLGMMAEAIIKLLGSQTSGVGSWDSGRAAVKAYLKKAGVPANQVTIDDGSGLSRNNRLSPAATTMVLQHIYNVKGGQFEALLDCLSHAGIDGTLEKRLKFPETKGRVFAKTGYIDGVRTLAGYVQTQSGKWVAFAFYYNQAGSTKPLTNLQDQACRVLATYAD